MGARSHQQHELKGTSRPAHPGQRTPIQATPSIGLLWAPRRCRWCSVVMVGTGRRCSGAGISGLYPDLQPAWKYLLKGYKHPRPDLSCVDRWRNPSMQIPSLREGKCPNYNNIDIECIAMKSIVFMMTSLSGMERKEPQAITARTRPAPTITLYTSLQARG